MHKIFSVVFMINFFFKKEKRYVETVQYLGVRTATICSGYMCGVQRVKPVSGLPVGGQAAAGAQWESLAPAGSSLDLPGSSTTPRNWHLCVLGGRSPDRWHLKPLMTCPCKELRPVGGMVATSSFRSPSIW